MLAFSKKFEKEFVCICMRAFLNLTNNLMHEGKNKNIFIFINTILNCNKL